MNQLDRVACHECINQDGSISSKLGSGYEVHIHLNIHLNVYLSSWANGFGVSRRLIGYEWMENSKTLEIKETKIFFGGESLSTL